MPRSAGSRRLIFWDRGCSRICVLQYALVSDTIDE
jgi:hypothetical protein